jgi:uncharacterized protein YjgD (DUF1641 family)
MAQGIPFAPPPRDPREELIRKLDKAPQEHAEALLDSYDILQLLRDKGILELTKGVLGSGEKVLEVLTKTLETEEAISLLRNLIILVKLVGGLNPEVLEEVQTALTHSVQRARNQNLRGSFMSCAAWPAQTVAGHSTPWRPSPKPLAEISIRPRSQDCAAKSARW